jgi:predicted Zn-dependent peptidase
MYFKYDNLLCIASSLAYDNINDAIKLIKKSIKEMQKGIFSEDDINDAKKNMLLSLNVNKNNPSAILASYEFNYFLGNYLINEKIDKLNAITKEDIVKLANKIVDNTYYVLSEDKNERN